MISKRYSNFNDFVPLSRGEKGNIDYKLSNNFQSAFEIVIKFYSNRLSRSFFIIIIVIIVALQFQPFFSQVFFPFLLGVKSPLNPSPRFFCKNKRKATVEKKIISIFCPFPWRNSIVIVLFARSCIQTKVFRFWHTFEVETGARIRFSAKIIHYVLHKSQIILKTTFFLSSSNIIRHPVIKIGCHFMSLLCVSIE